MYTLRGRLEPPPPMKKALENRYRVKMPKKRVKKIQKNIFFCFKQISKCDTCFYMQFSRALFKNIVFKTVALVIKKLWVILDFFSQTGRFFRPVPYGFSICKSDLRISKKQ